jgi:simple sugar transport system permease protein
MDQDMEKPTAAPRPASLPRRRSALLSSEMTRLSLLTLLIFIIMAALDPSRFLTLGNFSSMAFQFPEFAILSLAMMLSMMTGGIDLSIVGISNLSSVVAALLLSSLAGPDATGFAAAGTIGLAILAALLVGGICGLLNGLMIGIFGLPPILATLGSGLVFTGVAVAITGGSAVLGFPAAFAFLGNNAVFSLPVPLIIFVAIAATVWLVLERTALGLRIQMLGTNPLAARFAGIDDLAVTVRTYLLSGLFSAAAGLVIMSRANSAKADYGSSYLLLSILICVLGGINPYGGFGRVAGLVLAVLSLQFLSSGLNMLQVSNFAKELIWGGLLLAVMVANGIQFGRKNR